jgi:Kef-type K+ transport system membrane component KefB
MEAAWIARARWRWRGAWLWPTFVVAAFLDGVIATVRPFVGDRQSVAGGVLAGLVLNLLAVLFCSRGFGRLLRRRRGDMPVGVARNYGGTLAVVLVSAGLLAIGLVRHEGIVGNQRALRDAIVRAVAYIGDHAPQTYRANAQRTDTFTIQAGAVYRTCVPSQDGRRSYCVIVKPRLPLQNSVIFAGSEPNWLFAEGVN